MEPNEPVSFQQDFSRLTERLKNKKILITGGTGFFGKNLVEILRFGNLKLGWNVQIHTMARNASDQPASSGQTHVVGDLDSGDLSHFPDDLDLIIHAASPLHTALNPEPWKTYESISRSMETVLRIASTRNVESVLFTSSGAVYGRQPEDISHIPESYVGAPATQDALSVYGNAKRHAEIMGCLKSHEVGFRFVVARCFAFSGMHLPLDAHFAIGNFVRDFIRHAEIKIGGDPRTLRSYMDAEDLVYWLLVLLTEGRSRDPYNVGSDHAISIGDLAKTVSQMTTEAPLLIKGLENAQSGPLSQYVPSVEKAKRELSLDLKTSLGQSIRKMTQTRLA